MGKLRYNAATSLDGFIASPDGTTDWIIDDSSIDFEALYSEFDTFVMGRKTYEVMMSFGEKNPLSNRPKESVIVVSRTMKGEGFPNSTVIGEDVVDAIRILKDGKGRDIWLMGGGRLARLCLEAGLVDHIEAAIMPVILGSGIKMIAEGNKVVSNSYKLELEHSQKLDQSGILLTGYKVTYQR